MDVYSNNVRFSCVSAYLYVKRRNEMNLIILVFDIFTCIGVVVSLNLISRTYKAWLLYILASFTQLIVCAYKGVPGLGMMAVILFFTGIRNYYIDKKKALNKIKKVS